MPLKWPCWAMARECRIGSHSPGLWARRCLDIGGLVKEPPHPCFLPVSSLCPSPDSHHSFQHALYPILLRTQWCEYSCFEWNCGPSKFSVAHTELGLLISNLCECVTGELSPGELKDVSHSSAHGGLEFKWNGTLICAALENTYSDFFLFPHPSTSESMGIRTAQWNLHLKKNSNRWFQ